MQVGQRPAARDKPGRYRSLFAALYPAASASRRTSWRGYELAPFRVLKDGAPGRAIGRSRALTAAPAAGHDGGVRR